MSLSVSKSLPPVSISVINDFEKDLGFVLPEDYKLFILEHNGGKIKPNIFRIKDYPSSDNLGAVNKILGFSQSSSDSVETYLKIFQDRIPYGHIPIATDPGGNIIIMNITSDNLGTISFWEHEEEAEEGSSPEYDNVYVISDSFLDFITSLTMG